MALPRHSARCAHSSHVHRCRHLHRDGTALAAATLDQPLHTLTHPPVFLRYAEAAAEAIIIVIRDALWEKGVVAYINDSARSEIDARDKTKELFPRLS